MARKRIEQTVSNYVSWDDVNIALADIGEHQRAIEVLEAGMQEEIDSVKLRAEIEGRPHLDAIAQMELQIKAFVDDHRDEMEGKKTKVLTFGSTGYRKSTKVKVPSAKAKVKEIIARLRAKGMTDCIIVPPEKIDKDALKKYPPNDIIEIGAGLQVEDSFWYEVDRQRLDQRG